MRHTNLDQYAILFEQMVRCMTDPDQFNRDEFTGILRDLSILFRLSKGITEFYRSEAAEKAGDGEIFIDYDLGIKDHPVINRRIVTMSNTVLKSTLYMADYEDPLSEDEEEKLELILNVLLTFIGRNRLETSLEKFGFHEENGYPNLRYFNRLLESLISKEELSDYTAACFNLRHFSIINHELGRKGGDLVLKNYYNIVKDAVGDNGTVCRMGGDNFVTIFKKELKDKIIEIFSGVPVVCDPETNRRVSISASVGIYEIPDDGSVTHPGVVMEHVYPAMQIAKHNPERSIIHYDMEMVSLRDKNAMVHIQFPKALENNEFRVFYQPKVDVKTGKIVGAEALCRWFRDGKMVPPMDFIPALEQNADICRLDFHMLDMVCRDIRRWLDEGRGVVRISVNLSRKHLVDVDLLQHLLEIIDKNNVPHECIEIELTETATEVGFQALKRISSQLRENGFYISVDDFGMGYSSLNLIREISWNVLKIDRCFLPKDDDPETSITSQMYKHVVSMAQDLGLECVTEGVETSKQIEILRKNHCHTAQGFFFDKPLSVEEFEKRLERGYYDMDDHGV